MAALSIEITAPELVSALNHLAGALVNATNGDLKVNNPASAAQLPQTPNEQAARQRVVSASTYASAPMAPVAPQQPQYPQYPTPQQYQPTPVNPIPTAPAPGNPPMGAVNMAPAATLAPTNNAPIASPSNQAPVAAAPAYQIDDLARAAAQLMDAGKQQDLLALLAQFGVQTLGQLAPEQFGAFATALRQMGAKI